MTIVPCDVSSTTAWGPLGAALVDFAAGLASAVLVCGSSAAALETSANIRAPAVTNRCIVVLLLECLAPGAARGTAVYQDEGLAGTADLGHGSEPHGRSERRP